jgi:hypothetical protein
MEANKKLGKLSAGVIKVEKHWNRRQRLRAQFKQFFTLHV